MDASFNRKYWSDRWQEGQTGWDIGHASPPIIEYFDQVDNKQIEVLIPGAGNAWEAEHLFNSGFENVYVLDIAIEAIDQFKNRNPNFPEDQLLNEDFFNLEKQFDCIVEQTFFCALHPSLRSTYANKVYDLLKPNGRLVGLLFDDKLFEDHPPFGGTKPEYLNYFEPIFTIHKMEKAYNSIAPRADRELFINLQKDY